MNLYQYLQDGADPQAKAVLAFLSSGDGIEASWDDEQKRYLAEPKVARWENCREQGYIISLNSRNWDQQINIAFFEHRNSDQIHAIKWEQKSINPITIETAEFGDIYKNKYDTSFSVDYGCITEMADWIKKQLTYFWLETS